jgi:hypothetical protein
MANITIDDLIATPIASVTASHWLAIDNGVTTTKLTALDLTIQNIVTLGPVPHVSLVESYSLGTLSQRNIIGGTGVAVTQNTNDITWALVPGDINITQLGNIANFDLSLADNTTSQFLTGLINLTTGVTGILPVPNGGTGLGTLPDNSVLIGNGTSAIQAVLLNQNLNVVAGTATGPAAFTLTAGSNISIVQDNVANTITWNFLSGNFVQNGDSPNFVDLSITNNLTVAGSMTISQNITVTGNSTFGGPVCFMDSFEADSGTVIQTGSLTTGVTFNKVAGRIALFTDSIAGDTHVEFTLVNSYIKTTSVILVTLETQDNLPNNTGVHVGLGRIAQDGQVQITLTHSGNFPATPVVRLVHFFVINDCTANP